MLHALLGVLLLLLRQPQMLRMPEPCSHVQSCLPGRYVAHGQECSIVLADEADLCFTVQEDELCRPAHSSDQMHVADVSTGHHSWNST